MTTLEIILSTILYISLGLWITYKRNWYNGMRQDNAERFNINLLAVVLMPLNLIIVIFRELILREWDND